MATAAAIAAAAAAGMQGLGSFMGSKQNRKAQEHTNQTNLDLFNQQRAQQLDVTNPMLQGAAQAGGNFTQGLFEDPLGNPLAQMGMGAANGTNPLVQFANAQLSQGANPEQQTLANAQNALGGMLGGQQPAFNQQFSVGAPSFGPLSFGKQNVQQGQQANAQQIQAPGANLQQPGQAQAQQVGGPQFNFSPAQLQQFQQAQAGQVQAPSVGGFQELQFQQPQLGQNPFQQQAANPFAGMGQTNPGQAVIDAQLPIFQQQLQRAQGDLANATPGRFSSAFADQSMDLTARALRDFNMFGAQALQQGQQQQHAEQQTALNFLLGSRGQAADAFGQQQQAQLQGAGLQQQGALQARGLQQGLQTDQAQLGLQSQLANQSTALQAAGMNQQALGQFNEALLNQQNIFQTGQLGAGAQSLQALLANQQAGLQAQGMNQQATGQFNNAQLQQSQQQLQAAQANQQAALQAAGLNQEGMNAFNQASLQAQQLFQQGQLDSQGLQQQLFTTLQSLGLDANTAQQQAQLQAAQISQSGQLGAGGLLGQLAGQAGMNQFNRNLQSGQFGLAQQAQQQQALQQLVTNPTMQLLLGGMQFAQPSDLQTLVGPSGLLNMINQQGGGGGAQMQAMSANNNMGGSGGFDPTGGLPAPPPSIWQDPAAMQQWLRQNRQGGGAVSGGRGVV